MAVIVIAEEPADSDDPRRCVAQNDAELDRRSSTGFDAGAAPALGFGELTPLPGLGTTAREQGRSVDCGGVKMPDQSVREIERVWVSERVRGLDLGGCHRLELETLAIERGKPVAPIDRESPLADAIPRCRNRGYREVPPYNDEQAGDHWRVGYLAVGSWGGR
jgi:hypothetical protein